MLCPRFLLHCCTLPLKYRFNLISIRSLLPKFLCKFRPYFKYNSRSHSAIQQPVTGDIGGDRLYAVTRNRRQQSRKGSGSLDQYTPHGPNHQKPTSATLGTFKGGMNQGQLVGRVIRLAESRELSRCRTFLLR